MVVIPPWHSGGRGVKPDAGPWVFSCTRAGDGPLDAPPHSPPPLTSLSLPWNPALPDQALLLHACGFLEQNGRPTMAAELRRRFEAGEPLVAAAWRFVHLRRQPPASRVVVQVVKTRENKGGHTFFMPPGSLLSPQEPPELSATGH